ncbi:MAG: TIGR03620 family F420-dependent LLM class oxidoreductase [Acidobacteria bacterium]|nr:MAG: TIGR03620 family F420-dependent LLM class oxidoreductase [Acidobacteriota bacterium]REK00308.1 MAG: TIGR03620 family F420-dependent LLM class oxidoreductase [Acidobacteriota bacterium]
MPEADATPNGKPAHPGKLGVWTSLDTLAAPDAAALAARIDRWGYSTLWLPEAVGRDPFSLIGFLAAHTERLAFSTGIANIYARDAVLFKSIAKTLGDVLPGRFILGLGVSHPHLVKGFRGHEWEKPLGKMRAVLEGIAEARYLGREPELEPPIVIAALGPKMLELAGELCAGAHPYLVTPRHTEQARAILGDGPWLCPEQMVLLETDAEKARTLARGHLTVYLRAPNYQRSLLEQGFDESDFADPKKPSDRLVDALVAWGDEAAIRQRLQQHWDAGADHVCIQPFRPDGGLGPDETALEALAPGR